MAATRSLLRSPILKSPLRSLSTSAAATSNHNNHQSRHQPNTFLNSWNPPKDPKEAEAKLLQLRRQYAKKMKEVRKEYIQEMELQRLEKQRRDDARRESIRIAHEERKAAKAATKKAKAAEREAAEAEFRKTLLKERTEKLEYWRMKEKKIEEKKKDKNELVRRQSSMWVRWSGLSRGLILCGGQWGLSYLNLSQESHLSMPKQK
ncbi:hypothetical protein TEA_008455 [Camellia sinensis var. sinensis]|uniref:Uncharacterized protein n=1 Tax=Camellia sinensis var. sinensis TaxID=542762 RepID=A0A4S4E3D6_CAMSN|nr:hypothetical protein TEA_008455 [Camellia sinensis var. sinensis]